MSNPYHIQGPALISVSGGRTSGFMLRQIIDAHGGKLPADVIPVFCNTGKEVEATLLFVKELSERFTPIKWLEYRNDGGHRFVEVDYCSASRKGEPFDQVIAHRGMVPCRVARFCSGELKTRTGNRYAKSLGWEEWTRAVGMRADEPRRAVSLAADCPEETPVCPMYRAGHTLEDVMAFWRQQPFDLELPGGDNAFGNCDCCFLKRRVRIEKVMLAKPDAGEWWANHEEATGSVFRIDRPTYRQMLTQLSVQGRLLDDAIEDDTLPCACTD